MELPENKIEMKIEKNTKNRKFINIFFLLTAAVIWGFAFVAQSVGADRVTAFTINCTRNILGALVLVPFILFRDNEEKKKIKKGELTEKSAEEKKAQRKDLLIGGALSGFFLFAASTLQQIGIGYTTVGKSGFITAFYIILVPIFSIFLKKKTGILLWVSVGLTICGFYFLTMIGESELNIGDLWVLGCAFVFAFQILTIDHFVTRIDGVKLACTEFLFCSLFSGIAMLFFGRNTLEEIMGAIVPIVFLGVFSSGIAYTFQILGQKDFNPSVASLIMSLESVFSVLGGWLILGQTLTVFEGLGCVLIFSGIILAQLPQKD